MHELLEQRGPIIEVPSYNIDLRGSFFDLAACFASQQGTVFLPSCGSKDSSLHSFLALSPWLTLKSKGNRVRLEMDGESANYSMDPFSAVHNILQYYTLPGDEKHLPLSGLFGYLSYDLKDRLENLPRTAVDDLNLPEMLLCAPGILLEHRAGANRATLRIPLRRGDPQGRIKSLWQWFQARREQERILRKEHSSALSPLLHSNFTRRGYLNAVENIREYIRSGHIYQANLSQRFSAENNLEGFSAFRELFAANPAPFFAYIRAEDHQILSTSPERFLARRGSSVESRPIKGTRPRGQDRATDSSLAQELQNSEKDQAELSMIVDLVRNDLGRVCATGSVRVEEHKRLESYANVHHLLSVITGELAPGRESTDLLRAAFPGGSITGCPKVRAMEIIDELEPCRRHVYTGSIGYLGFNPCLDLSIAIRTVTLLRDTLIYSVGGGIVLDSDPEAEYEETIHKGRTMRERLVGQASQNSTPGEGFIWINGGLAPHSEASALARTPGFQYGAGVFETLRAEKGNPFFLSEHIQRMEHSWQQLFRTPPPSPDWAEIIRLVLRANGLLNSTAAIKLLLAKGSRQSPPFDDTIMVQATPYTDRLERLGKEGLSLSTYPEPRQSPLADHKTLNHLYYDLAGSWAQRQGADEALILNPDGSVSETNSANLLLLSGKNVFLPCSDHVLPGITCEQICGLLTGLGYTMQRKTLFPRDLWRADAVLLTNSLMGVVSCEEIDGVSLCQGRDIVTRLTRLLFQKQEE